MDIHYRNSVQPQQWGYQNHNIAPDRMLNVYQMNNRYVIV